MDGFIWAVEKISKLIDGKWKSVSQENTQFRIYYDQIFIVCNDVILESLNVKHLKKGFLKDKTMILVQEVEESFRKLKIKFSCDDTEIKKIQDILRHHFTIQDFNESNTQVSQELESTQQKTFQELFKEKMNQCATNANIGTLFPQDFPFKDFMKICIMDPEFSNFVEQVEKVFQEFMD